MAQESRLSVVIDSQQAQRDAEALNATLKKMTRIGEDATNSTNNLGIKLKAANNETQKLTPSINSATKAIENQNKELVKQEDQLEKNTNGLMAMAKYIGSFIALDRAIAAADGYTQMAARIRNATQSTEEYNLVQDRLLATANTTFRALNEAQEVYLSLSGGMKSLGYATKDTLDLSDSLSFAFTANATRADQAQSAMDALSKAMAKGKIDADAWISIVTGADNIIADMAKTTGRTEAEIRKLGAEGKASLEDLIATLIATREANEQLANNMENSFKDGLTKLTNEITVFLGKLNDTTKATGTMAAGLGYLGENIGTLVTIGGIAVSIYGGRLAAAFVLSGQKAIWSAAAITAQAGAMGSATIAARGLYAALGGPIGLAVGLGGVIASMYLFRDSADSATEALKDHSKYVDMTTESLTRLEGAQRLAANDSLTIEVETQSSKIKALNKDFVEYIATLTRTHKSNQELERIYAELRSGVISVEEAFKRLNKTDAITSEEITKAAEYERKHKDLSATLNESQAKLTATSKGIRGVGNDAKQTAVEVAGLSEEIKNLFKQANNNIITSTVTKRLADLNYDDRLISIINKYVAVEGSVNTATGKFYDEVKKRITEEYKAVLAQDKALDGRNEREKERLSILEQQGKVLQVNAKVQANAAKYNFSQLESKYKLPSGTLSSIHMIESKGDAKAYNKSTGASGGFQFLKGTADQYGVKNRNDLAQSAEGAAKYMSYLLKLFKGDLEKAVRAYHAGEGNVQKGENIGKYNNQYWKDFQGYMAGQSGLSFDAEFTVNDFDKILDDRSKLLVEQEHREKQLLDDQNILRGLYYDEWQKLEIDNQEKIKEINEKFASDPSERNRLLDLQKKAYEEDVGNWLKAQDQRYEAEQETNRQIIEARKAAFFTMSEFIGNMQAAGLDAMAQLSLSPLTYQRWQLNNQHQAGYSELANNLQSYKDSIDENPDISDAERYEQLTQAYETYRQNKLALSELYNQQELDLQNQMQAASLAGYGAMFGMMGSLLDAYGEKESAAYKAAFVMQKGFVLASAILNAKGAVMSAWNDPANVSIWQKMASAAAVVVQTNELMSAIQGVTLTGFSSGGYTGPGGKYDIAGTVHKGEVVFSQEDVARWGGPSNVESLRKSSQREFKQTELVQGAKNTASSPNIIINLPEGTEVNTSKAADGTITIDVVRKEAAAAARQSWVNLNNSNSFESKQIQRNTTAEVKR